MPLQGRISDHAFLRWLERSKGLDIPALEQEFVALCRPIIESGASGGWIEGDGYKSWLVLKDGNVVSTMKTQPQKHRKFGGRDKLKRARQDAFTKERVNYEREIE